MQVKKMIPGTDWSRRTGWLTVVGLIALGLVLVLGNTPAHAAQLTASWSDATPDDHTGFKVERKTGTSGAFAQVATMGATVMSYIDTTLTAGTTYCYRVRAYNTAGDSPYTPEGCAVAPTPVSRTLTVAKSGTGTGTVDSSPGGITCGSTCSATYTSGTTVSLSAAPATGATFTGWSGACTGTGGCAVVLDANKSATATFALSAPTTYALTVTKAGTGAGTVTSSPAGISCGSTCSASYNTGTSVTLTAAAATGSTFTGWSGACTGTGTCAVSMTAVRSVTATFALSTYALTVTKAGAGAGTVTSNPSGINCSTDCTENYNYNTSVTLTAAAATGSTFTGWSGGVCTGTGSCVVSMTTTRSVTATFTPTYALTVTKAGIGSGTVTSNTGGINCGSTCSASYTSGTSVTLTATASSGSTFSGWSGASCSGTGTCVVTVNAATSVTATFQSPPPAATLVAPSGNISTITPTYNWNAIPGVTWYLLWVRDGASNTKVTQWYTAAQAGCGAGTGTCSATPSIVVPAGVAQWWVQPWSPAGYGPWGSGMGFTVTGSTPPAATLISPSGTTAATAPTYTWNAVATATYYYLWVRDAAGTTKIQTWYSAAQVGCAGGTGTCTITPSTSLSAGGHTWWVDTWNSAGYGPWSGGIGFSVSP